ncbi:hypothetical protein C8R46DRAFT_1356339 [Mycena filopes]|nr:hypothetical protein C8R46DRAFT_1356339 [Mycena filopes]
MRRFALPIFLSLVSAGASLSRTPVVYEAPVILENIAVRASSQLLLTSIVSPTLLSFDPTAINGTFDAVHTFPNATSLTGIVEYRPGVFALLASITNTTTNRMVPGSIALWSVEFTGSTPLVREIGVLAYITLANGLTFLPSAPDILLCADSVSGVVWQIDARTGATRIAIQDPSMNPDAPAPAVGVDGVHIRFEGATPYLYFTNAEKATFSRVALKLNHGFNVTAAGAVQTLATIPPADQQQQPDDFTLDERGRAWVGVWPGALMVFSPPATRNGNWTQMTALGNVDGTDPALLHPTSAAFGRGSSVQRSMLYVVTATGQVVAIDTSE